MTANDVVDFWFSDRVRKLWWDTNTELDNEIRSTFGTTIDAAIDGSLRAWETTPHGALGLTLVLDQLTRNTSRGTPRAFAGDARARQVAAAALARGFDRELSLEQRMFLYMPFEHSEQLADQERSVALFQAWVASHDEAARAQIEDHIDYAIRHKQIIERFGRFPHRNAALGRESTPEEVTFLAGPGSSF